ncbi:Rrf2 family transcriptional regulator [Phaeovibrio sulfidiphilus]|uniref:Rrf2 family transcriptional regulator n=1 Tax=Phaeovibrio sulfidiphilus TaxID=1220600 RepID=A0A8J7CC63_9PROT|nr:Rrf2 family transcriptional regulator [Phaeovibrio sulfidiphilus]
MKLQTSTLYALIAMLELTARPDESVSASEIAQRHNLPLSHLAKVLRELGKARFVEASRGIGGGYRLASPGRKVTLHDVISVFEPTPRAGTNGAGQPILGSTAESAALDAFFQELGSLQTALLASMTFHTLARAGARGSREEDSAPGASLTASLRARA